MDNIPGRRIKTTLTIGAISLTVIAVSAACSTQHTNHSSSKKVDTLNIPETTPTFTRNFNTFSPTSKKSPAINLFYEPLVRIDYTHSNQVKPWLAKSFHYSNGGKTLTFKLRHHVKFSDGKPLTSKDVKYSLELPTKTKGLGAAPIPHLKHVTTPDKHTAVVHYTKPELHDLANYGDDPRLVVPAHIWKHHNPKKWTNPKPVGTGAFTFESFGAQNIKLATRKQYWHGKFHGVKHVQFKASGSEESTKQRLLKNKVTWTQMSWPNYKNDFVKKDPQHNHYWTSYPRGGGYEGIVFNMKKSPTRNVHVRRALYSALNSSKILSLFRAGQKRANATGLNGSVWQKYMPAKLRQKRHKQSIEKAKSELKASGYKVKDGKLAKHGKTYPLSLRTNSDYSSWNAYVPGMKRQWEKTLGLKVTTKKSREEQLGEYQENGDFQMMVDFIDNGKDIWSSLHTQLSSDYRKPLGQTANGDYGRYKNAEVDHLLDRMANTRQSSKLKRYTAKIARIVEKDVPYGPLWGGSSFVDVNSTDWTGWPKPGETEYIPDMGAPADNTMTIQQLKPNK